MAAVNAITSNLVKTHLEVGGKKYCVFSGTNHSNAMMFYFFSSIVSKVVEEIGKILRNTPENNSLLSPGMVPGLLIHRESLERCINEYSRSLLDTFETENIRSVTDVIHGVRNASIGKAANIALQFFCAHLVVPRLSDEQHLKEWEFGFAFKALERLFQEFGSVRSVDEVTFHEEHLQLFGVKRETITQDAKLLSCFAYVLLHTGEVRAKSYIFVKEDHDQLGSNVFSILTNWNYTSVENPEEGDLVLYRTNEGEVGHAGVYKSSNRVLSKFGMRTHYTFEHRLFDLWPRYGLNLLFMRKSSE